MSTLNNFYNGEKILVAGGAGFIGSHLVDKLVEMGAQVTATIFKKQPFVPNPKAKYFKINLENSDDCELLTHDKKYIFMCAANSSGAKVIESSPLTHLANNIIINSQLLRAAYNSNVEKFCFISSSTVYPNVSYPVSEKDSSYQFYEKYYVVGWMKKFSELMCEMYSKMGEHKMKTLIIRPANLYGPRDKFSEIDSKVIPSLIRKGLQKYNPFEVWGDGKDLKDFLYIDDFIDGLVHIFSNYHPDNHIAYNIASGKSITINEVLEIILRLCNFESATIEYKLDKPTMIPIRRINVSKIQNRIDWVPETTLEDGLKKTINWYSDILKINSRN